jgi:hypothetical protein
MRDFGMNMEVGMDPRDMETMSMAACLNRIMITVRRQCSDSEQRIFLYLCHHYVSWGDKEMEFCHLGNFISDKDDEQKFYRFFQAEKHRFQKMGLVTFEGEKGRILIVSVIGPLVYYHSINI